MRFLWKVTKVLVGLAIAIPLGIIALGLAFGVLGAVIGLAMLALKIGVIALCAWAVFRVVVALTGGRRPSPPPPPPMRPLPPPDPHYEAAMRELDEALGERPRTR